MFATYMLHDDSLLNEITQATTSDPLATDIMARLNNPSQEMQTLDLSHFTNQDGLLYRNRLLYVPAGTCRTRDHDTVLVVVDRFRRWLTLSDVQKPCLGMRHLTFF